LEGVVELLDGGTELRADPPGPVVIEPWTWFIDLSCQQ
jgi:hypothetical protein